MYSFRKIGFEDYFEYFSKNGGSFLGDEEYRVLLTPGSGGDSNEKGNAVILGKL